MNKKILLVPTLIAGVTISFVACKYSFAAQQGEINAASVNFRESASQTSNIIQSLGKGEKVSIDGEEGNFYKITYNSKTGYVSKQFVKVSSDSSSDETANSNTSSSTTNTTSSSTNATSTNAKDQTEQLTEEEAIKKNEVSLKNDETMYSLPLLNSTEIGTIAKDEKVTLVSVNGKWAYVRGSKNSGWINKESLSSVIIYLPSGAENSSSETEETNNEENGASTVEVEETENENTTSSESTSENTTAENTNTSANITTDTNNTTSADNEKKSTATASDTKSTTSSSNGDNSSSKTKYVNADSVNIRDKASTSSEIIGALEKNTSITVIGTEGEWSRIQTSGGAKGYILTKYLSASKQ